MFETNPVLLKKLLDDVEDCNIQLPDFQRGWIWDDDRVRGLLASISQGFPIGAIMMLESGGNINFKCRPVEGLSGNGNPENFLLDGQQRLTSLYQALRHKDSVKTHDSRGKLINCWYYIDMINASAPNVDREDAIISVPQDKKIKRDFGRKIVLDLSSRKLEYGQHMIPTERLLDPMDWLFEYEDYWRNNNVRHPKGDPATLRKEFKSKVLENFSNYSLPVITLKRGTPKEAVCTVFEKVNTGGVSLSTFELVTAVFAANNFSLRNDWEKRRQDMHSYGVLQGIEGVLQGIEGEQFLQAVTLLTTQQRRKQAIANGTPKDQAPPISCKKRDILELSLSDYNYWADEVQKGFKEAANFLHGQFVFAQRDVPYNTQLVPLAALYVELGKLSANAESLLESWYWSGIFGERYGSAVETQFALDLEEVAVYIREGTQPRLVAEASFVPERLISLRTRSSAAYKGLYALQMKSGAADWRTGKSLSLAIWHDENIDIHHIFPVAWCKNQGIPSSLYNSVINKTPIDAHTNRIIGGQNPSSYLKKLDKEVNNLDQVLKKHWLEPRLVRADNFSESFVKRGQEIFELINKAMGKPSVDGRKAFKDALKSGGVDDVFVW